MKKNTYLTLGQAAKQIGCKRWQLQRAFDRELLPDPQRIGLFRVVAAEELPQIKLALQQCGYLRAVCEADDFD
jgi:hypothetical protein